MFEATTSRHLSYSKHLQNDADRPTTVLTTERCVVLRGEERDCGPLPLDSLLGKMRRWDPKMYRNLPYVFGYVASADKITLLAIDHTLHATEILPAQSLRLSDDRTRVVHLLYKLALLFAARDRTCREDHCHRDLWMYSVPFGAAQPSHCGWSVWIDGGLHVTIKRAACVEEEDYDRLLDVYVTLEEITRKRGGDMAHLSRVTRLRLEQSGHEVPLARYPHLLRTEDVVVPSWLRGGLPNPHRLGGFMALVLPVGYPKRPGKDDVAQWLRGMLRALVAWHATGYCHGTVSWPNMLFVPQDGWVLSGFEYAHKAGTQKIDWEHSHRGEMLDFHHDLVQLGELLATLAVELTPNEMAVMHALRLGGSQMTRASAVLDLLGDELPVEKDLQPAAQAMAVVET